MNVIVTSPNGYPIQSSSSPFRYVFVVDDHPLMQTILTQVISDQDGLKVCGVASDGKEALCKIFRTHPDLIICDLLLPEMDGYALIRCLRIAKITAPVVVFSAMPLEEAKSELGPIPRLYFVSKGATMEDLMAVITQALSESRASRLDRVCSD
ncbi:DNA-binding NarL/FixJ family response regulator [Silvimonas terrae]|uniref:DNA-binding NarL/FixJ family response regulator n=1 Tax=Silvimonas terrae TaxID=300266 RepID=A0A840RAM4_9NEIS|nr:response regulator [Silvimonas terrae]MBB5189588.1 DNA-binding NarL/FixJ family response regulator [Silvimonas terrae]